MPRPVLIAGPLLAVLAASAPSAAPAHAPADLPARVPLTATVERCTTGPAADDRAVVFSGSLPADRRGVQMAMRFELQERSSGDAAYDRVPVPGFADWVRSQPRVAGFVYDKRVMQLAAPAAYRVVVRFRWYDGEGHVVRRATRTSPPCRQPA